VLARHLGFSGRIARARRRADYDLTAFAVGNAKTVARFLLDTLEHFRAKWKPVRVKEMRPNNSLERFFDSVKLGTALAMANISVKKPL